MRTPRTELFKDGARVGIWCRVAQRHAKMASDSFNNFCLPRTQSSASGFIEQEKSLCCLLSSGKVPLLSLHVLGCRLCLCTCVWMVCRCRLFSAASSLFLYKLLSSELPFSTLACHLNRLFMTHCWPKEASQRRRTGNVTSRDSGLDRHRPEFTCRITPVWFYTSNNI